MGKPDQNAAVHLRAATRVDPPPAELRPILHQPLVAASLVLIVATAAQIAVYLVNARLLARAADIILVAPSSLVANGQLFRSLVLLIEQGSAFGVPAERLTFSILLVLTLISTLGWYLLAYHLLGPAWGLWCGIACSLHPLFGFLAQRPSALTLSLVLVPLGWAVLLWWHRSRRRRVGLLAGAVAGLCAFQSLAFGLAFVVATPLLFATGRVNRRSVQAFVLVWIGFALPLVGMGFMLADSENAALLDAFRRDSLKVIEGGQSPLAAGATLHADSPAQAASADPLGLLGQSLRENPLDWLKWLGVRAWQVLYATADGHFQRPLFAVQLAVLLPAFWGLWVCLRQPSWRWPAAASLILLVSHWMVAAFAEPLARSLAPAGGVIVIFALVCVADLYERAFGRRLEGPGV